MERNYEELVNKYVNAAELMEYAEKHTVGVDANDLSFFINGHSVSTDCIKVEPETINMIEQIYVFIFQDGSHYIMNCGISLKDAIWEMSKYTGFSCDLFRKALHGFDNTDIDGIVQLSNHFALGTHQTIEKVYTVSNVLYDNTKELVEA